MNYEALDFEQLLALAQEEPDDDGYGKYHWECVFAVVARDSEATFAWLQSALRRGDSECRFVCDVFGKLREANSPHSKTIATLLIELLAEADDQLVIGAIISALGHGEGEPRILQALLSQVTHPYVMVRWHLIFGLGGYREPEAVEALLTLARDDDELVRDWALLKLRELKIDSPAIRAAFVHAMTDEDAMVREEALCGLAKLRDKRVVPAVLREIDEEGHSALFEQIAEHTPNYQLLPALLEMAKDEGFLGDRAGLSKAIERCEAYINRGIEHDN
ncbi:hypothetical protein EON80_12590 [bacterium]|nr:MAG: hypothetical protein EON80_12590 [bacterium]